MIRAIMHGCNGRMGQFITGIAAGDEKIEIVAGVDPSGHIQNKYPVFDSIEKCDVEADVIIDFASAKATDTYRHMIQVTLNHAGHCIDLSDPVHLVPEEFHPDGSA